MSSLKDMPNFLFVSMTRPKLAKRIQVVSILLHEATPVLELFCFIRTQLVEVVMCQIQ